MDNGVYHQNISKAETKSLRLLLARSLKYNQLLILQNIGRYSITATIKSIADKTGVPISTLKLNYRILRELGLLEIDDSESHAVRLTEAGKLVISILKSE